ncbi:MAG: hypothetical protein M1817_005425 [Caeruleum heppii]|nr:MAG: hypothetical protein M1817_005425 [Caeruleum heppii]
MLSSFLHPNTKRRPKQTSPFSSPFTLEEASPLIARRTRAVQQRQPARVYNEGDSTAPDNDYDDEDEDNDGDAPQLVLNDDDDQDNDEAEDDEDEDEDADLSPLLPIFSAAHLDSIPSYHLTHTIRLLVIARCETTLTWDQLRSPQVSSFLVKPIQQRIRTSHFSRATLYALMANNLQFGKEAQLNPGNSGTSKTRALVCELLAIKLLREFTTRELIDALSYDFNPMQGLNPSATGNSTPGPQWQRSQPPVPRPARISTLEIAIRAQAKRFLAHPSVVQHLEAIWAGSIVFHSAADHLHRPVEKINPVQARTYATNSSGEPTWQVSPGRLQPSKQRDHQQPLEVTTRRAVTLYDPRDASLFKLSRLRVPRYRQTLSTCSLAILLALFLAVLIERSLTITPLEVIFWFWSAGFMLDEVVGFNEQGFSLYIMSFWNTFDLGILLLLVVYYVMRLYGILMSQDGKRQVADMAYDILAANAVLLFPRLFSVLDHYRYFSQLLIAFRLMAVDLVAVFILILITCSGFFVAFTLSFGKGAYDARGVAYSLFQLLLGFTPAAWNTWDDYNALGKIIMTVFLFICHFLIITILITVLTNSFMAIVANANDEHQFVFAVNTISMVKSDALFSYIAPTNIIAWILTPLRYFMSFRRFVRLNRHVIKVTHFPVLLAIYLYERVILRHVAVEPTDLIDARGRFRDRLALPHRASVNLFSPQSRMRQESVLGFRKDQALDEVFRRPFDSTNPRTGQKSQERRKNSNVVSHWMQGMGSDGKASPPAEQDRSVVDRLETRRQTPRRSTDRRRRLRSGTRNFTEATRSVASDPEDFMSKEPLSGPELPQTESDLPNMSMDETVEQGGAFGDDEMAVNDDDDDDDDDDGTTPDRNITGEGKARTQRGSADYFQTRSRVQRQASAARATQPSTQPVSAQAVRSPRKPSKPATPQHTTRAHGRNTSTTTILYNPVLEARQSSASPPKRMASGSRSPTSGGMETPKGAGKRSPRRVGHAITRPRPIMPPRSQLRSAPNLAGLVMIDGRSLHHRPSSLALDLTSELGENFNMQANHMLGAVPSSFATQMAMATGAVGNVRHGGEDANMMSRLMLARMKTLEESFREVVREVKEMRNQDGSGGGLMMGGERAHKRRSGERQQKESRSFPVIAPMTAVSTSGVEQNEEEEPGIRKEDTS